jgi:hypothetical protein
MRGALAAIVCLLSAFALSAVAIVPPGTPISPGDTVLLGERWF